MSGQKKQGTPTKKLILEIGTKSYYKTKRGIERHVGRQKDLISAPIHFAANVRDVEGGIVQVKVVFRDADGNRHTVLVPKAEFLAPFPVIQRLANKGFEIEDPREFRCLLPELWQKQRPRATIAVTSRPGWHTVGDRLVYLTPAWVAGVNDGETPPIELLPDSRSAIAVKGTVDSWNEAVAGLCAGSSRPMVAICAALTAPVLYLLEEPNIGLGFVGLSSTGKSTALAAAATVFGPPLRYLNTFDATNAGLDAMALSRSDALLALDELGEGDPKVIATASYRLLNGRGRRRLDLDGQLNDPDLFRGVLAFSGELTVAEHLREGNIQAKTGQIVRLAAIPVPEGGMFKEQDGYKNTRRLVQAVQHGCRANYGAVGKRWVKILARDPATATRRIRDLGAAQLESLLALETTDLPSNIAGRMAETMALVGAVGEYAISKKLVRWEKGSAAVAVRKCFIGWAREAVVQQRVAREDPLARVRRFFQSESGGKFVPLDEYQDAERHGLAGFEHVLKGTPCYLVYPEYFAQHLCKKSTTASVLAALNRSGYLMTDSRGGPTKQVRIPNTPDKRRVGFYVIRKSIIES